MVYYSVVVMENLLALRSAVCSAYLKVVYLDIQTALNSVVYLEYQMDTPWVDKLDEESVAR